MTPVCHVCGLSTIVFRFFAKVYRKVFSFFFSYTCTDAVAVCVMIETHLERVGYVASEHALLARELVQRPGFEAFFRLDDLESSSASGRARALIRYIHKN